MQASRVEIIDSKLRERLETAWNELAAAHDKDSQNDIAYWTTAWDKEQADQFVRETIWPVKDKIYHLEHLIIRLSFRLSLVSDYQALPDNFFYR